MSSRRTFLKSTLSGLLLLSFWPFPREARAARGNGAEGQAEAYAFLTRAEVPLFEAIVERVSPLEGSPVAAGRLADLTRAVDAFIGGMDWEMKAQFHKLLGVFNAPLFVLFGIGAWASFTDLEPEQKDAYLWNWATSDLGLKRQGFQALKRVILSVSYADPELRALTGYLPVWKR